MIKSKKVKKLLDENGLEIQNFSMINRLKKIITDLHKQINDQMLNIQNLKKDSKITKINEMQVEIQHLNDQNKRLILIIQEIKKTNKMKFQIKNQQKTTGSTFKTTISKKSSQQSHLKKEDKQDLMKQFQKEKKFQTKYYQLLNDYQKIKKEIINLKIFEAPSIKKRKSQNIIDKNCLILQKNALFIQKISQQKLDAQAQNNVMRAKILSLQQKIQHLQVENQLKQKKYLALELQLQSSKYYCEKQTFTTDKRDFPSELKKTSDKSQSQNENRFSLEC